MFWWTLIAVLLVLGLGTAVYRAKTCSEGVDAWLCYQIARILSITFFHWRPLNLSTIPEHGPAIIVANHTSPVDPVILWLGHFRGFKKPRLRVIGFMMAREYYIGGAIGWVCRSMQSIPVDRDGKDMSPVKEALQRLKDGKLLGLFPEGKLNVASPDEQLLPGGTGVAWLALKARVPVIPIFIKGAPRSDSMVKAFFTWSHARVKYGPAIDLSKWHDQRPTHSMLAAATDEIMRALAELGGVTITPVQLRTEEANKPGPAAPI